MKLGNRPGKSSAGTQARQGHRAEQPVIAIQAQPVVQAITRQPKKTAKKWKKSK